MTSQYWVAVAAATLLVGAGASAQSNSPGNILLIVADDMGVGEVGAYGVGLDAPPTPNLDLMAAGGVRFTNAWTSPLCSPTRAQIQTGRHAFRTGVGTVIHGNANGLPLSEVTLPEMLDRSSAGYGHATIGKWHLGVGAEDANSAGYDHYAGMNGSTGLNQHYYDWRGEINGTPTSGTQYLTTREVDDAKAWIDGASEPWFVHLSFHAPHAPLQAPPSELHSFTLPPDPPTTAAEMRLVYKAMVEAMDTEIGNLLAHLGPKLQQTTVLFLGDNGTHTSWVAAPYASYQGKATMFQAGIQVPMIAVGPGIVRGGVCDALVHAVDIFPTLADLADVNVGVEFPGLELDGLSLRPYFANPDFPSARDLVHSEYFGPNGVGTPYTFEYRAVRDHRYKLAHFNGFELFYDLRFDPFEMNNLADDPLTPRQALAFQLLSFRLHQPGTTDPYTPQLPPDYAP